MDYQIFRTGNPCGCPRTCNTHSYKYAAPKAGTGVRYVVPQNINLDAESDVKLYFRVRDVYRNAKITVKSGDKVIYSKKKPKLCPGEMEYVVVKAEDIRALDVKELVVSAEV